jgi:hypothetical protein
MQEALGKWAQLEAVNRHSQRFCKPKVGSSILSTGTNKINNFANLVAPSKGDPDPGGDAGLQGATFSEA